MFKAIAARLGTRRNSEAPPALPESAGYEDRFQWFCPFVADSLRDSILVSGCAAGIELAVARQFGFRRVIGTEIDPGPLKKSPGDRVLYDGVHLPFGDGAFGVVASGHIIEHTPDPRRYLHEHLRVLRPGGMMFLEFPDRNHGIELHTGVPGFEWLPDASRDLACAWLASRQSCLPEELRARYLEILTTLRPVGVRDAAGMAASAPWSCEVRRIAKPIRGFVRMIIWKRGA